MEVDELLLNVRQVAGLLGVDPETVRTMLEDGRLTAVNIAPDGARHRTLRVQRSELERFVDSRRSVAS